jgi:putative oxidoreductase
MRQDDLGKLLLRLTLAILLLFHGISKILHGVGWMQGLLTAHGLPGFIAYGAYLDEIVAPLLLMLGLFTRIAGLIVVGNMVTALWLVHLGQLTAINADTGGYALELQIFYLCSGLAVVLLGAGRYSLGGARGRFN